MSNLSDLAINGGEKTIKRPFQGRFHFGEEEKEAINKLLDNAIQTGNAPGYNGEQEVKYCEEFSEFMGGGFADGVNSGTNSVYVALRALEPEPFSEIIVGCVTDPGGMMPIPLMNCIPIVADSAKGQYNTGPKEIEALITPRTSVIIVAHIGGEPADIVGIMNLARKHNISVLEDCSQSHGAEINGQKVGTFGDIAAFSVMFGKHHCTGGQGGIVFTKREDLYYKIRRAADRGKPFGIEKPNGNCFASLNFNLDEFSSAIGRVQLKKLPSIIENRRKYAKLLQEKYFCKLESIKIPDLVIGGKHVYWWWRLEVDTDKISCSKSEFCDALVAEGLAMASSYNFALPHLGDWFKNKSVFGTSSLPWSSEQYTGNSKGDFICPNADQAMNKMFNLNISESWGDKEAKLIYKAIKKVESVYLK